VHAHSRSLAVTSPAAQGAQLDATVVVYVVHGASSNRMRASDSAMIIHSPISGLTARKKLSHM